MYTKKNCGEERYYAMKSLDLLVHGGNKKAFSVMIYDFYILYRQRISLLPVSGEDHCQCPTLGILLPSLPH